MKLKHTDSVLTTLKRGADPESSEDRTAGGSHDHRVSPLQVTAVRAQVSLTRNQVTQTVQLMTAGLHFGEIKKIPATEKARKIDSADLCSPFCIIFAMNKSSPRTTIGCSSCGAPERSSNAPRCYGDSSSRSSTKR